MKAKHLSGITVSHHTWQKKEIKCKPTRRINTNHFT